MIALLHRPFRCPIAPRPPPRRPQGLLARFAARKDAWTAAVDSVAQLDALISLAVTAACAGGPMCRPKLVAWSEEGE